MSEVECPKCKAKFKIKMMMQPPKAVIVVESVQP